MLSTLGMLFRAKKIISISFLLIFGILMLAIFLKPSKYQARMTFLLRNERAEPLVGADPHQNSIQLPDVTEENLNSEVELLNSSEVLRQTVLFCHLTTSDRAAAIDKATSTLAKRLTVTPVRNSSIIDVSYDSIDKDQARQVLETLAKVYLTKRANLHTASQATAFFNNENDKALQSLRKTQADRSDFLSRNGYGNLQQQIQLSQEYIQNLHGQLDNAQTQLQETEGQLAQTSLNRQSTAQRIPTQLHSATNPYATQQLTGSLVTLQNRRAELLTKFSPGDRAIQEVDTEIKNVHDALSGFVDLKPQETISDANPAWLALDAETNHLHEAKMGLAGRIKELRAQLAAEQDHLVRMQHDTATVDDMDRGVKAAAERLDLYENKSVAAKIADDLDAQHISNVVVASGPTTPAVPEASSLNPTSAFLFSLLVSFSIGLLSSLLSPRLYGPERIESELGIPVLATVPAIYNA